jgi:hypothetical protein
MSFKPVEALALASLSMVATPIWTTAQDWYMLQGVFFGAAVGALLTNTTIPLRLWRLGVSMLIGYWCAGIFCNWFGDGSREMIRFIAGCVGFGGFAAAKAVELAMPGAFKSAAKASVDALITRVAALGVVSGTTDRASDIYRRGTLGDYQSDTPSEPGNSSDAR